MSSEQYLIDVATRHQVFLQRYGGGQSKEALTFLNRLRRDILARIADQPTEWMESRLLDLQKDIEALIELQLEGMNQNLLTNIDQLALSEAKFSAGMISKATVGATFTYPAESQLLAILAASKMQAPKHAGITIKDALNDFKVKKKKQILNIIGDGVALGDNNQKISEKVRQVMTTLLPRQSESLVRTIVNHTSSLSREAVFEENKRILKGYKWVATLDNRTTLICASRDGELYEIDSPARKMPPAHYNCVLGDTLITSATGVSAVTKRVFKGKIITINTISGNNVSVTPNHPILTAKGWMPAKFINIGDSCINQLQAKGVSSVDGDNNGTFESAQDIFESFGTSFGMESRKVMISSPDFHNDGIDGEVAEIRATRNLSFVRDFGIIKKARKSILYFRNMMRAFGCLHRFSPLAFFLKRFTPAFSCFVGIFNKRLSFTGCSSIHSSLLLGRPTANENVVFHQDSLYGTWRDAEHICNASNTYAGGVFADDVIGIKISDFVGHVYNLQTLDHCYAANGIITHNCRSTTVPVLKDEFDLNLQGTRPSRGGEGFERVSANETYGTWLKKQPESFVVEALGEDRAKLFLSGRLTLDKFVDPTGRIYTLDELERMNPFAFDLNKPN